MDRDGRQIQLARDPLLVVIDLKVDPQVRRGAEKAAEPQRHFDRDGLFLGEDAVNRLARDAKRGGDAPVWHAPAIACADAKAAGDACRAGPGPMHRLQRRRAPG